MTGNRRITTAVGLLTAALAPLLAGSVSADPPDVAIDGFATELSFETECEGGWQLDAIESESSVGGALEAGVVCYGNAAYRLTSGNGELAVTRLSGEPPAYGLLLLTWDGNGDPWAFDRMGLGGIDLTAGGSKDAIALTVGSGAPRSPVELPQFDVTVHTIISTDPPVIVDASSRLVTVPGNATGASVVLPLTEFEGVTVVEPDFRRVGALALGASMIGESLSFGPITTTTLGQATLEAELVDVDGDGRPTPGDTIRYTALVSAPYAVAELENVVFRIPAATLGGQLVAGSVEVSNGTVTVGNNDGDTSIEAELANLTGPEPIELRFDVTADALGVVSTQGQLTYTTNGPRVSLTTTTDTDDPNTPEYSDPTTIEIVEPAIVSISGPTSVNEHDGPVTFAVTLSDPPVAPVTVTAATENGTAIAGVDYIARTDVLTFEPGETSVEFVVDLIDDDEVEDDETFTVVLSDPAGALLGTSQATVTITDTDVPPTTPATTIPAPTTAPPTTDPPTTVAPTTAPPTTASPTTIAPPPPPPPSTTTTVPLAPQLPETGGNSRGLIAVSIVLLVGGVTLLAATRRRIT